MRTTRIMLTLGGAAFILLCAPAFGQPMPAPKPKTAEHVGATKNPTKNKSLARRAQRERTTARLQSFAVTAPPQAPVTGWPALVREARKYMGTNPTDRSRLWCATFMNMVLAKTGYAGTNSDAARSFAQYGHRISEPRVGAIAVLTRGKNGGHVGVVSGIDANGNPIVISGNHGRKVGEAIYPRSRVIAYVMPSGRRGPTQYADRNGSPRASDGELESPIAELLAVIESEYNAKGRPRGTGPEPRPLPPSQARRDLPLDPGLAEFLGLKERAAQPAALPQQQQRELRVEQRASGRVASNAAIVISR